MRMIATLDEKLEAETEKQFKSEEPENRLAKVISGVIDTIEERKPWESYDKREKKPRYQTPSIYSQTPVIVVQEQPQGKMEHSYEKPSRQSFEEEKPTSESDKQSAQEPMNIKEAATMADRIRYGKFFGTLNELTADEKERWHNWTRSPINKVHRALTEGSYFKLKGYHAFN